MDKGKLKVLLFDLKGIVSELESEIYSDVDAYTNKKKDYAFSSRILRRSSSGCSGPRAMQPFVRLRL